MSLKILVKVRPNSKIEKVEKAGDNGFIVYVKPPPKDGRANEATIRLLSTYFDIPKAGIRIIKGYASRNKIIELLC